jgi:truncated hemoglobin YjbI
MRHAPFAIGTLERDRWLNHMNDALEATATSHDVPTEIVRAMSEYFDRGSTAMINRGNGREERPVD